jgi:hypothetical protein
MVRATECYVPNYYVLEWDAIIPEDITEEI